MLLLLLRLIKGSLIDPYMRDYGFNIFWGIMPPGGATLEEFMGPQHYLMRPPKSGADLPFNRTIHRKRELFTFRQGDSGKTVYFCIRMVNSKGEVGNWGPIFSAVIP
jgi:hypothetical protein